MDDSLALFDAIVAQQAVAVAPLHASFPDALTVLHTTKYTGPVVVHFAEGKPKALELTNPTRVKVG